MAYHVICQPATKYRTWDSDNPRYNIEHPALQKLIYQNSMNETKTQLHNYAPTLCCVKKSLVFNVCIHFKRSENRQIMVYVHDNLLFSQPFKEHPTMNHLSILGIS